MLFVLVFPDVLCLLPSLCEYITITGWKLVGCSEKHGKVCFLFRKYLKYRSFVINKYKVFCDACFRYASDIPICDIWKRRSDSEGMGMSLKQSRGNISPATKHQPAFFVLHLPQSPVRSFYCIPQLGTWYLRTLTSGVNGLDQR